MRLGWSVTVGAFVAPSLGTGVSLTAGGSSVIAGDIVGSLGSGASLFGVVVGAFVSFVLNTFTPPFFPLISYWPEFKSRERKTILYCFRGAKTNVSTRNTHKATIRL